MVFLGIVCRLTKDGMKKRAPWGGCTRWGVLGGMGIQVLFIYCVGGPLRRDLRG